MNDLLARLHVYPIVTPTPFPVGPVNCYLYKGDALTLIDAGTATDAAYDALQAGLADYGVAVADIERIILTHHHVDHMGLAGRVVDASGAQVCAHKDFITHLRLAYSFDAAQRQFHRELLLLMGASPEKANVDMKRQERFRPLIPEVPVDCYLEDRATVEGFTVHFVPGHAPTDILLVNHAQGFSVVGDHILERINPNPLLRRPVAGFPREKSLVQYQQSLAYSRTLPLGVCLPGHGAPFVQHEKVIDGILAQQDKRSEKVLHYIHDAAVTPYTLSQMMYPKQHADEFFLCLSVAAGHLELLESHGVLASELLNDTMYYFRTEFLGQGDAI